MFNPGGSVKDRIGVAMIEAAEAEGRIEPGRTTIVEATSGNTGIALAFVCAAKGYDLILTLPQGMSREREGLLRLYGAQVQITESLGGMNEAVAAAQALARDDDFWLPDQFSNPANPDAHYRGTGPELWEALDGNVDVPRRRRRHRRHDHRRGRLPEGAQPEAAGDRGRARRPRRCSPAGAPGRTRSRASARASSRRCSTATCSTRSSPSTTRTRWRPRGSSRAARACSPGSPAAPRCGGRCRSPSARRRGRRIAVVLPDSGERYVSTPFFAPEAGRRARAEWRCARRRRLARARRGSGRCAARSTGSSSSPSASPATRSATRPRARCGSTARPASATSRCRPST